MSVNLEALTKPFPKEAIKRRRGGGGKWFDYVEGHAVIHRLNDATGNNWSFHVKSVERHGNLLIAVGELEIPGHGVRSGMGVQMVADGSGEDLAKGVLTDCLKKCATLFGVALELYGPDYEDEDAQSVAPQQQATPRQQPSRPHPSDSINETTGWLARISQAASPADCIEIRRALHAAGIQDREHPAQKALRQRYAELNTQIAEMAGA